MITQSKAMRSEVAVWFLTLFTAGYLTGRLVAWWLVRRELRRRTDFRARLVRHSRTPTLFNITRFDDRQRINDPNRRQNPEPAIPMTNYPCRLPGANARDKDVIVPEGYAPKVVGYCRRGDRYWHASSETWLPVVDSHSFLGAAVHAVTAVIAQSPEPSTLVLPDPEMDPENPP